MQRLMHSPLGSLTGNSNLTVTDQKHDCSSYKLFMSHLPHLNNSQLHPSTLQTENLGVISDSSLSLIHGNGSHQQILSLYLLNRARIQPCLTTSTITILIQAIISSSWIVTIIGLPASTSSCPTVCSQHSSQRGLFKTALRSLHASTQHPPVPSHLTWGKNRFYQDLQGPTITWFLPNSLRSSPEMLPCTYSATAIGFLAHAQPVAFLLAPKSAWEVLQPNIHKANLSLPAICLNGTSLVPSLITLQKNSKCPSPLAHLFSHLFTIFLHSIYSHLKCMFIYMSPALPYTIIKQEFCLICLLLYHLCLKECPAHSRCS